MSSSQSGSATEDEIKEKKKYTSTNNNLGIEIIFGSSIGLLEEHPYIKGVYNITEYKNDYHIPNQLKGKEIDYLTIKISNEDFSHLRVSKKDTRIRRSEDYILRICSLICRSSAIQERIEKQYSVDINVYEKILKLLSVKILDRISYFERGQRRPYPFAAASAYVADKLLSRKIKQSSALTQKLVAQLTNTSRFTIRNHAEFLFSYDYDDIITITQD